MATKIHGIAASENIDSSGERIIIAGMDISSLEKDGVFNWEHKSDQPAQVVGKILKAKKIFSEKDCENDDERGFWEKCGVPFVYVMGELLDDYKDSAKEVAAQFRYDHDHKDRDERSISNFSIEGAKIDKVGMDIPHSIARKVTITVHPCNKVAVASIKLDKKDKKSNDINSLFKTESIEIELCRTEELGFINLAKKEDPAAHAKALGVAPMKKDDQDLAGTTGAPAGVAKKVLPKLQNQQITPGSTPLIKDGEAGKKLGTTSGGHDILSHKRVHEYGALSPKDHLEAANFHFNAASGAGNPKDGAHHMDKVRLHMSAHKTASRREERLHPYESERLIKALDAGSGMAAPSNLAGGAALGSESFSLDRKMKKNPMLARAEEEYQSWDKKEEFVNFMQQKVPGMKKGEIDAIGRTVALRKGMADSKKWLAKFDLSGEGNRPGGSFVMKDEELDKSAQRHPPKTPGTKSPTVRQTREKGTMEQKGVHMPPLGQSAGGRSVMGAFVDDKDKYATRHAGHTLKELKNMPKPNLPKSEEMNKSSDIMMLNEKSMSSMKKFFSKAIDDQAKELKTKDINDLC